MQWGSGNIDKLASAVSAQDADTILVRHPCFLFHSPISDNVISTRLNSPPSIIQGFNEPDSASEANIQPNDAAALWMEFIQPFKQQGARLGGPAVTAAPIGKQWLMDFFAECNNCSFDFLPLHW
jgi:hypothetical protein